MNQRQQDKNKLNKITLWDFRENLSAEWLTFRTHSYSPNFESNVPFCRERSLRVKRGPSSWIPTFFSFLKMYLERAKTMFTGLHKFKTTLPEQPLKSEGLITKHQVKLKSEFTVKTLTCGIWKRWSLFGCGRWQPVDPQTVGLVEREQQTAGRCCDPDVCWNC